MTKNELKVVEILKERNIFLERNNEILKTENLILLHKVASLQEELFINEMNNVHQIPTLKTLENIRKW